MREKLSFNDPEVVEGLQDEPEQNRRRSLLWIILSLVLIVVLAGIGAQLVVTQESSPLVVSADEPLLLSRQPVVDQPTAISTGQPQQEPTAESTDQPTPSVLARLQRGMPTGAPTGGPAGGSLPPGPAAGDQPALNGACAQNGGLQWAGEICGCSGVVDVVTICMDGAKSDMLTGISCSPRPEDCPAPTPEDSRPPAPAPPACRCQCPQRGVSGYCYDTCTEEKCGKQ